MTAIKLWMYFICYHPFIIKWLPCSFGLSAQQQLGYIGSAVEKSDDIRIGACTLDVQLF